MSFISLEKVIPTVARLLKPEGRIVALVKPQFQAKRQEVGKKGVVRDSQVHAAVLGRLVAWGAANGLRLLGLTTSPLRGPAGQQGVLRFVADAADVVAAGLRARPEKCRRRWPVRSIA